MESRGIYMSTDAVTVRRYADELLGAIANWPARLAEWEKTAGFGR